MKISQIFFSILLLSALLSCKENIDPIDPGNDPHFTIKAHDDKGMQKSNRKVTVVGIDIYAAPEVDDSKLLHAAHVLSQYIDNDEDSFVDNPLIIAKMVENRAYLYMWKKESDLPRNPPSDRIGQDLGDDETQPNFVTNGKTGRFDAALEEVLHLITHAGYANQYPNVFGEQVGTKIADAMDMARGGQFTSIPDPYPARAWYSYDDQTCDYSCMVTEYHYWALTSMLGAQTNRLSEIEQEWKLNTRAKVETQDSIVFRLLTDPKYAFPTVLPDGTYMP
jgi:hypothetical protein